MTFVYFDPICEPFKHMKNKYYSNMLSKKEEKHIESEVQQIMTYLRRESGGPGLNQFSELTKHIFMSSWVGASNREALKDYKIDRIICLSGEMKPRSLMDTYEVNGINHKALPVSDNINEDISRYFELVYNEIHSAVTNDENILIHCHAGNSLSASFVLYYYLKRYYVTNFGKNTKEDFNLVDPRNFVLLDILKFVKEYRPCVEPNAEFVNQLLIAEMFIKKRLKQFLDKQLETENKYKRDRDIKETEKRKKDRAKPNNEKIESELSSQVSEASLEESVSSEDTSS